MLKILVVIIVIFTLMPFLMLGLGHGVLRRGNRKKYGVAQTETLKNSPLAGKTIIFLGSAVTYGSASGGESFVEFLAKRDGILPIKEAVPGTTLVDGKRSYIARMKAIASVRAADAFVCQLSTNDASRQIPLGVISKGFDLSEFDTGTVTGAMEYIIAYAKATWNCPVIFYTSPRYVSREYGVMVNRLLELEKKWKIGVLDMWDDHEMYLVTRKERMLYMVDSIHPTRAGYRDWWTPKFENYLVDYLKL